MKKVIWLILIPAFACTLAVENGTDENAIRPVLQEDRPSVILLAPKNGSRYAFGTEIVIYVEARDMGAELTRVEVMDSFDNKLGTVTSENPQDNLSGTIRWKPAAPQTYLLRAQAYRADDTASSPYEISITVVETETVTVVNSSSVQSTPNTTPATSNTTPVVMLEGVVRGASALNVRSLPDTAAERIAQPINEGEVMQIIGRSEDGTWYLIRLENGDLGWVFGQFVEVRGDVNTLPTVKPDEITP